MNMSGTTFIGHHLFLSIPREAGSLLQET